MKSAPRSNHALRKDTQGEFPTNHKYTVLYYKRKNKIHKSKGVSKFDGCLTFEGNLRSVSVTLKSSDTEAIVYYGGFRGTTCVFKVDEIISIGSYEVEILSRDDSGQQNNHFVKPGLGSSKNLSLNHGRINPRPARNLLPKRGNNLNGTPRLASKVGLGKRSQSGSGLRTSKGLLGTKRPHQGNSIRKPPPQPLPSAPNTKESSFTGENVENMENQPRFASSGSVLRSKTSKLHNVGVSLPKHATMDKFTSVGVRHRPGFGKPSRTIASTNHSLASANSDAGTSASNPNSFPGAVGNLQVPYSIQRVLRPHQLEGVVFLWNCLTGNSGVEKVSPHLGLASLLEDEASGTVQRDQPLHPQPPPKGCILSDEMGLGKTLMTIATIAALHRWKRTNRFVVVCPSSLVNNWAREFDKWLGKVGLPKRVVVRKGGEEGMQKIKAFNAVKPSNISEVLIVSYDLFRMKATILENVQRVALLVVDEGHRLKNAAGSQTMTALESLPCEARLCITATPLQNNLCDMYAIVNFVCPGVLGDLSTFRRQYERPIQAASRKHCTREQKQKASESSQTLDQILHSVMLRRLQKDVLKQLLPPRHVFLLFCRPTTEQRQVYQKIADRHTSKLGGLGPSPEALTALMQLRKVCTHPNLLNADVCPSRLECESSGKLLVIREIVLQLRSMSPDDKIVMISNFTSTLEIIEDLILKPLELNFLRLDGSVSSADRQTLVDTFNRTSAKTNFALTLSSKAGGVGLNVIGANRLIMVDPDWNPATDVQAMARIYREGQKKPCFIYRCFTSGTLEEIILQRQIQKGSLATNTVDRAYQSKGVGKTLNADELRDCFTLKNEKCKCDTRDRVGRWPDYDGERSLKAQGCADSTLLEVSTKRNSNGSLMSFVHIVQDEEIEPSIDFPLNENEVKVDAGFDGSERDNYLEGNGMECDIDGLKTRTADDAIESSDEEFEFE